MTKSNARKKEILLDVKRLELSRLLSYFPAISRKKKLCRVSFLNDVTNKVKVVIHLHFICIVCGLDTRVRVSMNHNFADVGFRLCSSESAAG